MGVHPDLVRVVRQAASLIAPGPLGFVVTEGLRTVERQTELVAVGASRTMNSKHLKGHAIDFAVTVNGDVRWDWPLYHSLAEVFKGASTLERVPIIWGGDWRTFKDGPHIELDDDYY